MKTHPKKVLGVLGGMGPAATLDFLAKVQAATPAEGDEDHVRVLMDLNPQIPDRDVPGGAAGPVLADMTRRLREAGADVLAMPCNTAHLHVAEIRAAAGDLPLIDLIEVAIDEAAASGATRIGILGTPPALDLYAERLTARDLTPVLPTVPAQEAFMALLDSIKAGDTSPEARDAMAAIALTLETAGADAVIAGCTEVPMVLGPADIAVPLIDGADVLARRCVEACV